MSSTREYHDDGSYTDRWDEPQGFPGTVSITYNPDGSIREQVNSTSSLPIPGFLVPPENHDLVVTKDGDGKIINAQYKK